MTAGEWEAAAGRRRLDLPLPLLAEQLEVKMAGTGSGRFQPLDEHAQ